MKDAAAGMNIGANHRRILSILLRALEGSGEEIEHALVRKPGILWRVENDFSREEQERLQSRLHRFRGEIRRLASQWKLKESTFNARRSVIVQLSSAIVNLEDSDSSRLKGYGALPEETKTEIDKELRRLAVLLEEMMKDLMSH